MYIFGESLDFIGHHRSLAVLDGLEQIAIGDQAHALIPGVVARGKMSRDIVFGSQGSLDPIEYPILHPFGTALAQIKEVDSKEYVSPSHQCRRPVSRGAASQEILVIASCSGRATT